MRDFLSLLHIFRSKKVNKQERIATTGVFLDLTVLVEKLLTTTEKLFFRSFTIFSFKERERSIHKKYAFNFASNASLHIRIGTMGKEKTWLLFTGPILAVYIIYLSLL